MKCSEYLWKRVELDANAPDEWMPERVQGEMFAIMNESNDTVIVSDITGKEMTQRDAGSIYSRNSDRLNEFFKQGNREEFERICLQQLRSDAENDAAHDAESDSGFNVTPAE